MNIQSRAAKIARLAFHQRHVNAEKALLASPAAAELRLVKEAFGTDGLAAPAVDSLKTLARIDEASIVRKFAIARTAAQLTPAERALAGAMAKRPGNTSWMKALAEMKDSLVAPSQKETRSAIGKLLRGDFVKGRADSFNPDREVREGVGMLQRHTAMTKVWATLESAPELLARFAKTGKFQYSDVVWVSKKTGIEAERVNAVMERLARVAPERPYPLETTVLQRKTHGAFSAGGGQFGIHEQSLRLAKTDDELAYLLGHELAHDAHRDVGGLRRMQHRMGDWQKRAKDAGVPRETREKIQALFDEQQAAIRRIMESEADADGLRYAARAGYDPEAGPGFMNKIEPKPKADKFYLEEGYPPTRKRIQAMNNLIEQGRL
jgi:hypothetical protein